MQIKIQRQPNLKIPPGSIAIGEVQGQPIAPDTLVYCGGSLHLWNTVRQMCPESEPVTLTAAFVRALRKHRGQTQAEFGEVLGQTERAVRSWEAGKRRPSGAALKTMVSMVPD